VTSLILSFNYPIDSRLDLSSVIAFIAAQPNRMDMSISFRSNELDGDVIVIVERILANVSAQCPIGVHSLSFRIHDDILPLFTRVQYLPRLLQLLSNSTLTRFAVREQRDLQARFLSPEQEQRMAVITQRNRAIPVYLQTTYLLEPTRRSPPPPVMMMMVNPIDPPIVVYANDNDGTDRRQHQYVLSHALSQAAVHPIFLSHFYQYVRDHADLLFGLEGRRPAPAAPPPPPPP
jgi:hypothetical protein